MELKTVISFTPVKSRPLTVINRQKAESDTLGDECMMDELRHEDNILEWMSVHESASVSVQQHKITSLAKCRSVASSLCVGYFALEWDPESCPPFAVNNSRPFGLYYCVLGPSTIVEFAGLLDRDAVACSRESCYDSSVFEMQALGCPSSPVKEGKLDNAGHYAR